MINRVVLVGRLTKDPDLRTSTGGTSINSFTVAIDNRAKAGTEKTASFINCVAFGQTAENMAKYTRKGSLLGVEGRLQQRSYDNKEGKKVSVLEVLCDSVQFLDPKGTAEPKAGTGYTAQEEPISDSKNLEGIDTVDDDLPF